MNPRFPDLHLARPPSVWELIALVPSVDERKEVRVRAAVEALGLSWERLAAAHDHTSEPPEKILRRLLADELAPPRFRGGRDLLRPGQPVTWVEP